MYSTMSRRSLEDGEGSFDLTVLEASSPSRVVVFAVGGGGNPDRHLPLLSSLAERGATVVAPHFPRLVVPTPTEGDLLLRARRLRLALDSVARLDAIAVGVGHSLGATTLLALAGGEVWMRPGHKLAIPTDARLGRLVLLAPATDFFRAPGALDSVRTPIAAWVGTNDVITPPHQGELLRRSLSGRVPVDVRVIEGAGHFSFMSSPPPQTTEPLADRDEFLAELTRDVCAFVMS
jgi:pimeloyl-ACP methyl ester carboxylesterase